MFDEGTIRRGVLFANDRGMCEAAAQTAAVDLQFLFFRVSFRK
jgi:hypothetical protein